MAIFRPILPLFVAAAGIVFAAEPAVDWAKVRGETLEHYQSFGDYAFLRIHHQVLLLRR